MEIDTGARRGRGGNGRVGSRGQRGGPSEEERAAAATRRRRVANPEVGRAAFFARLRRKNRGIKKEN